MDKFSQARLTFLILINLSSFLLVWYDKRQAKSYGWRIAEKSFFSLAIFGGASGIFLGMKVFRHKTKHRLFSFGIPLLIGLNLFSLYWLSL